jgi:hypothetical protein
MDNGRPAERRFVTAALLLLVATWCPEAAETGSAPSAGRAASLPATLRHEPRFILETVARRLGVALRPEIPSPAIFFESTTSLRQFQQAIAAQWGFRPRVFANAYVAARNEIYLIDDPALYARLGYSLDESLAHELVHYLQVQYMRADLADPTCESDAVAVQLWFRDAIVGPSRGLAERGDRDVRDAQSL